LLRLLFQDATETLEDRHPPLEQLVIILRGGGQALDREIRTGGLLASERAIVQVGFVTSASTWCLCNDCYTSRQALHSCKASEEETR